MKGKVDELIKDERGIKKEIIGKLELGNILGRDIKDLSGGELQRVAIAAAVCKQGDIYYFDEPSSFLDVHHRIQMARVIRDLAEKDQKAVMVVEHDLMTLDILTDVVYLVYGSPGAYGVISYPYASRRGVNSYLDGTITEENMRIRDSKLSFKDVGQIFQGSAKAVEYPDLEHSFAGFSMKADAGFIYYGEVLGVVGRNALGKTTFARMLAGELKPKKGDADLAMQISYKPQYLKADFEGTVYELLASSVKSINSSEYKIEILKPLGIEPLFDKTVSKLSGGELQRVAIALCFGKEADFYLLDEPSAYLDVDQRMDFAKMVRKFVAEKSKSCLVIDHDMMLVNYISDRILMFTGVPGEKGHALAPTKLKGGMDAFLKELDITLRRDPESGRPRANKEGSQKDQEQRRKGNWYER